MSRSEDEASFLMDMFFASLKHAVWYVTPCTKNTGTFVNASFQTDNLWQGHSTPQLPENASHSPLECTSRRLHTWC